MLLNFYTFPDPFFSSFFALVVLFSFVGTISLPWDCGVATRANKGLSVLVREGRAGTRLPADGCGIMETSELITLTNDFLRKWK